LTWNIEIDDRAAKELRSLDAQAQKEIKRYLRDKIATDEDPRRFGKALGRELNGLWRYRVGNYRLVCMIEDAVFIVLVIRIGHQKNVYR
jgi:mRNA interferase RelE/StbE